MYILGGDEGGGPESSARIRGYGHGYRYRYICIPTPTTMHMHTCAQQRRIGP